MKSYEVRKTFLDHFQQYDHQLFKSSSLIPADDPTLLFNNAGMNQFKGVFTGDQPAPKSKKATSSQKCVRAGGKHNDLDNVGFTARHHTFFEMLGNFSFGDYFKVGAIEMAWELLTKKFNLDPKKLYVSVYQDDDEAADIWKKHISIPSDKIYRFGQKDNFWRMGDTGPCGPCSEIFYDLGDSVGGDPTQNVMGGDGDRFIEIWNLVFMQFYEDESGKLNPLPKPSIDTGMGLERISAILQGQTNNYNSDLFLPLIEVASRISKTNYSLNMPTNDKKAAALRVIADHSRAVSFLLADGVIPSNEGRGYVLRRILRRAVRYARTLSDASIFPEVCKQVIITMDDFYPELNQSKDFILQTVKDEETRFLETLDKGTELLTDEINRLKKKNLKTLDGEFVFKLYDTFGFPADLTQLMAQEQGLKIDETGFNKQLTLAKEKSKSAQNQKTFIVNNTELINETHKLKATKFLGYDLDNSDNKNNNFYKKINDINIVKLFQAQTDQIQEVKELSVGQTGFIIFESTPFYAEGGGQSADIGKGSTKKAKFDVKDVQKYNNVFVHTIVVTEGSLSVNDRTELSVDWQERRKTAANHSATHLLHYALREVIGTHVKQAGSLVNAEKLRFDFTNKGPLTEEDIFAIEKTVNKMITDNLEVQSSIKTYPEAIKAGALALFGEKYEDEVRVVDMRQSLPDGVHPPTPDSKLSGSIELCGGTHVKNLGDIKYFKIISESGVSSGVRRIEALTNDNALKYLNQEFENYKTIKNILQLPVQAKVADVSSQIQKLRTEIQDLKKELKASAINSFSIEDAVKQTLNVNNIKYLVLETDISDSNILRETADKLRDKMNDGVVVLRGALSEKTPILVAVQKDLSKKVQAGQIVKQITGKLGGSGGGRPDFAQGAIANTSAFMTTSQEVVKSYIESTL